MKSSDRRAALATYKERKVQAGIYAVHCAATGQQWIGKAPDLATIRNRLWFTLRQGNNPHRSLQEAWALHGADVFSFEVVEQVEEEALQFGRDRALKGRLDHWIAIRGGAPI
ncbi:GIY-YIG nuclease family protein [Novosphingobium humi]|uniref:GIY-YIG nuclease family protein n=1 Tax=Novosphingobium humi TaxID=2282397 RepID=UPI0025B1253D|nr:GIY-YIG nuclease family protein [Novosphingobium humi]WJT00806.1 GIY-YIG nuclease family protein [Novosphingobium humi]